MVQTSQPWDGIATGDADRAPYDENEWDDMFEGMFDSDVDRGVLQDRAFELVGSLPGNPLFRISTGEALVKGKWYRSNANTTWTLLPPPGGAGDDWREDRIVLSRTRSAINDVNRDPAIQEAQTTRLIRLINPANESNAPLMTKNADLWEIALYRIQITAAGVVSMPNDDREFIVRGGAVDTHDHEGVDSVVLDNDALVDRVRKFFVIAIGEDPIDDQAKWAGYELVDNAEHTVFGYGMVPSDFVSDLTVQVVVIPTGTGNIYGYLAAAYSACGDIWNVHEDDYNAAFQAIPVTLNERECIMSFALANAAAGDMINLEYVRDAVDGLDTVDALVYCPGFLVSYTADS